MFCRNCAKELSSSSGFCPYCGTKNAVPQSGTRQEEPPRPTQQPVRQPTQQPTQQPMQQSHEVRSSSDFQELFKPYFSQQGQNQPSAQVSVHQNLPPQFIPAASQTTVTVPANKKKKSKLPLIIVALVLVAAIVVAGVIFLPDLLKKDDAQKDVQVQVQPEETLETVWLISTIDEDGDKREYTYDQNGNITNFKYYEYGVLQSEENVVFDDKGNIVSDIVEYVDEETFRWDYEYDSNGNCIKETEMCDGEETGRTEYEYDANGNNIKLISYEEGEADFSVTNRYDDKGNCIESICYDKHGVEEIRTVYTFDDQNNNIIEISYSGNVQVSRTDRQYDANNKCIRTESRYYEGDPSVNVFKYDDKGNLIEEIYGYGAITANRSVYEYDADGHITRQEYYEGENLTSVDAYVFDDNGNLTEETTEQEGIITAQTLYKFDEKGNCIEETYSSKYGDTSVITYEYDGNGNCIKETQIYQGETYEIVRSYVSIEVSPERAEEIKEEQQFLLY